MWVWSSESSKLRLPQDHNIVKIYVSEVFSQILAKKSKSSHYFCQVRSLVRHSGSFLIVVSWFKAVLEEALMRAFKQSWVNWKWVDPSEKVKSLVSVWCNFFGWGDAKKELLIITIKWECHYAMLLQNNKTMAYQRAYMTVTGWLVVTRLLT